MPCLETRVCRRHSLVCAVHAPRTPKNPTYSNIQKCADLHRRYGGRCGRPRRPARLRVVGGHGRVAQRAHERVDGDRGVVLLAAGHQARGRQQVPGELVARQKPCAPAQRHTSTPASGCQGQRDGVSSTFWIKRKTPAVSPACSTATEPPASLRTAPPASARSLPPEPARRARRCTLD